MRIAYLPVCQVWVITLGTAIIDLDGQSLWPDKKILIGELKLKGLKVSKNNSIESY